MTLEEILLESEKENSSGLPFIRWEFQSGGLPVPFLGYPFIAVGHSKFDCSQGKDRNVSKKERFMEQKEKEKQFGIHKKTRTLVRPTKKMGCPVTMSCKKVYIFPSSSIPKDTKRNRTNMARKLRQQLVLLLKRSHDRDKSTSEEEMGSLVYLTKFADPRGHRYHLEFQDQNITPSKDISDMDPLFHVGACFDKLKDLEDVLDRYRKEFNVKLYRVVKESFRSNDPLLKYQQLTYKCLHALRKFIGSDEKNRYERCDVRS